MKHPCSAGAMDTICRHVKQDNFPVWFHNILRYPGWVLQLLRGVFWRSEEDAEDGIEPLRPLRNFPAVALITAIHSAIEVLSC